ncbi:hypothetical protein MMC30_001221 [Trapelia coarctata]|nr:hypothetical protein [Trapelia coarctata]
MNNIDTKRSPCPNHRDEVTKSRSPAPLPSSTVLSPLPSVSQSPSPATTTPPITYTVFTSRQKRSLVLVLGLTMLASPLTATIYLPLLPLLAQHFEVSNQAINLTITLYIVFQALSPAIFATLSDTLGRRPIYLTTYTLYTVASLSLALNRSSYAALLVLRALQSLGASAVLAVAYGVVADVCVPAERGKMLGPLMGAANLAVCIGPVIGGWVALGSGSYEWVFWSLVIFGGINLLAIGWTFPETARNVVGNGSIIPGVWGQTWSSALGLWLVGRKRREMGLEDGIDMEATSETRKESTAQRKARFKDVNPLVCLRIIFWRDTALVLWMAASPYAVYYCVQTSIPSIYKDIYQYNEFEIGLSYLTGGAGVVLGGIANGRLMDYNYKVTAKRIGHTVDKVSGDDMNHFPIERARARGSWVLLGVYICALAGYGWAVQTRAHQSIPLILQFVLGALCTCFQQTFNALLVDIFPGSPSTAAASGNITRCTLSAVAVAIMQPLVDVMGRGWFFTLLTLVSGVGGLATVWAIQTRGMKWRGQRISKAGEDGGKGNPGAEEVAQGQEPTKQDAG